MCLSGTPNEKKTTELVKPLRCAVAHTQTRFAKHKYSSKPPEISGSAELYGCYWLWLGFTFSIHSMRNNRTDVLRHSSMVHYDYHNFRPCTFCVCVKIFMRKIYSALFIQMENMQSMQCDWVDLNQFKLSTPSNIRQNIKFVIRIYVDILAYAYPSINLLCVGEIGVNKNCQTQWLRGVWAHMFCISCISDRAP